MVLKIILCQAYIRQRLLKISLKVKFGKNNHLSIFYKIRKNEMKPALFLLFCQLGKEDIYVSDCILEFFLIFTGCILLIPKSTMKN